jgi:hypothetical protein
MRMSPCYSYMRHFRGILTSRTFQALLQPLGIFAANAMLAGVLLLMCNAVCG